MLFYLFRSNDLMKLYLIGVLREQALVRMTEYISIYM